MEVLFPPPEKTAVWFMREKLESAHPEFRGILFYSTNQSLLVYYGKIRYEQLLKELYENFTSVRVLRNFQG